MAMVQPLSIALSHPVTGDGGSPQRAVLSHASIVTWDWWQTAYTLATISLMSNKLQQASQGPVTIRSIRLDWLLSWLWIEESCASWVFTSHRSMTPASAAVHFHKSLTWSGGARPVCIGVLQMKCGMQTCLHCHADCVISSVQYTVVQLIRLELKSTKVILSTVLYVRHAQIHFEGTLIIWCFCSQSHHFIFWGTCPLHPPGTMPMLLVIIVTTNAWMTLWSDFIFYLLY